MSKAKKVVTPEEQQAKDLAELQKKAKKLKIQFDKETPLAELQMLVKAGEDAAAARETAKKEQETVAPSSSTIQPGDQHATPAAPSPANPDPQGANGVVVGTKVTAPGAAAQTTVVTAPIIPPAADETAEQMASGEAEAAPVAKGDTIIHSLTTRNKETFNLVKTADKKGKPGEVVLRTKFGQVVGTFENEAEGMRHMENLSRH